MELLAFYLGRVCWMTTEEDLRNGCAVAYRKADAILCGEPRDSNGLNRDQIAAVRKLTFRSCYFSIAASASKQNLVPVLVRFEDLDLFHVAPVVFLMFDLDCISCGCIQVNFYTQVLCRSYPTDWMIIDSLQWTHV